MDTEFHVPKIVHEHLKEKMEILKGAFGYVLDHLSLIKNRSGKD
ncbi:hypothetical protein [Flagellimonas oceanensis]|nr:hypothetical protein [Allomuricauda oceanensis]